MRNRFLAVLFMGLAVFLVIFIFKFNRSHNTSKAPSLSGSLVAQELESFSILDTKGTSHTLFKDDSLTFVVFWATWCSPCMAELPHFISLYNQYHKEGLNIVGFSLDDTQEDLEEILEDYNVPFPNTMMSGDVSRRFGGVYSIPFTVIVKGNKILDTKLGYGKKSYFESFLTKENLTTSSVSNP